MIHELLPENHPLLKEELEKFDFDNPPTDPIELAHDLAQTMIKYNGIGLAANQIGLPYRAFAIKANPIIVCFNPKIVDESDDIVLLEEGCLSYPGLFVKIKRPEVIKVRYWEPNGNVVTTKFQGLTARVYMHELDHLNGIVFLNRANRYHLEQARKKRNKVNYEIRADFPTMGTRQ